MILTAHLLRRPSERRFPDWREHRTTRKKEEQPLNRPLLFERRRPENVSDPERSLTVTAESGSAATDPLKIMRQEEMASHTLYAKEVKEDSPSLGD
jgi:hypothetical protein